MPFTIYGLQHFSFSIEYDMFKDMDPRIIPRKEHHISRKQLSPNALRTLYRLRSNGFIAYLVGGCVRDLLLARTPKDFDIATNATPTQVKRLFRNCRLIGRRFRLAHLHFQDEILEVSTFRRAAVPSDSVIIEETGQHQRPPRHVKDDDGMVLRDNVFGTPEEDALCRDFTINALAYNIADFSIIDYSTGLSDLRERLIRLIGDPYIRFAEDPVRMLRAVRFAASHDFVVEPAAWESLCGLASTITRVPPARLYEEIQKLFLLGSSRPALTLLEKSGLLTAIFPGLSQWISTDSHRMTLLETNLDLLDKLHRSGKPPSLALFLSALFGPSLEEETLASHRDGIPYHQALDAACAMFMQEITRTVTIPGRIGSQLRAILALQPALHRVPPRRPAATAGRTEFRDALMYLRLAVEVRGQSRSTLEWWETFPLENPSVTSSEPPTDETPPKKRRRRRGKRRRGRPPV